MGAVFDDGWDFILGAGSMFDRLQRDPRINVDPHIYHGALIYEDHGREFLASVIREYADIAQVHGLPCMMSTATWRASVERIANSRVAGEDVNRDAAVYLEEVRQGYGRGAETIITAGLVGPKGDAYKPDDAPVREAARRFHAPQIEALADTSVDLLEAKTLPALDEALGIADIMAETKKPYMLSFVLLPSGTLLDGTPLGDAIARIDDEVSRPPEHH